MFKCLYCVKYFSSTKGRSHHESRYCTKRLKQNVINDDANDGFDNFIHEDVTFNDNDNFSYIVNEDLTYVYMQESFYRKCFNLDCLYQSNDFNSFLQKMPTYSDSELLINKLAEFKKTAHLSRVICESYRRGTIR